MGNPPVLSNLSYGHPTYHVNVIKLIKMKDYMDGRVAFGSGLVPLGRQAEKRKELSFASPNLFATQKPTKR